MTSHGNHTNTQRRVFLVHGTFAPDADWIQRGSKLSTSIRETLDAETIGISWSGKNSHSARKKASEALSAFLRDDVRDYPLASRSIVAHSHGGNVALAALRQLETEITVDNLVCLGTPFLVCDSTLSRRFGSSGPFSPATNQIHRTKLERKKNNELARPAR
jgi:triacylglycerol esterase/lipase EstA (alpha/beta hydrolase family)